jgi:hypothetical protein
MTEIQVPQGALPPGMMTDEEQALADAIYQAIQDASHESPRSQQAGQFRIGVSDLGFCPERTRRMLDGQVPERTDVLAAWVGTALGDHLEQAWVAKHPDWRRQLPIEVRLRVNIGDRRYEVVVPGHPDLVHRRGKMIDAKTDFGLTDPLRNGPSRQQQYQRHLYGLGCYEAGYFDPDVDLDDVVVGNVWLDRGAVDKFAVVKMEKFNPEVVDEARDWLEDVIYHLVNKQEAEKVPPRDMCAVVCGYYEECRAFDTDTSGLVTEEQVIRHAAIYREGQVLASKGDRLKKEAKAHLDGIDGMIRLDEGIFQLRHTWRNPTILENGTVKRGYTVIELREVKAPKGKS